MNIDFSDMGGGIIQDLPPEQIKRNQWSGGNNVRFVRAQVTKITGHTEVFGTLSASNTVGSLALGNCHYLLQIDDDSNAPWWVYCDLDKIYATDGSQHIDISHSGTGSNSISFAATEDYSWNGGRFNGLAILNSHAQAPRVWIPGSSNKTIELTNWPASTKCRVLRPYKTFLIAIGVDEGAGFNDNVIRWPTAADVGGVPSSWDYADPAEDAGRAELDDGFGLLVDGQQLRNDFFIYAEHAIYRLSPVPGNDIFAIRRQFSEVGLLTRHCIATVRHQHVFFGDGDIYIHDGQSMKSIVTKRWKKWVFSQIGDNWKRSYVVPNYIENEVWFCFPTGSDEYATKALVWDFDDNTLSSRDLFDKSKGGCSFIGYGKMPRGADDSFDTGNALQFDDEHDTVFDQGSTDISVQNLVMSQYYSSSASATIATFFEVDTTQTFGTDSFTAYVEKDCVPLGRRGEFNQYDEYQIHAIRPRVRSTTGGDMKVMIGVRDSVGDAVDWVESATFAMNTDEKVDVRVTGTVITLRFETDTDVNWELNGFGVEYDIVGSRER